MMHQYFNGRYSDFDYNKNYQLSYRGTQKMQGKIGIRAIATNPTYKFPPHR